MNIPTPRRILFLGTHGQYNIGDELLLETFLTQLGRQHHYVVNTYDRDFTRAQLGDRFDVDLIDTRHDRRALLGHVRRSDVVVFGGGSIVKELYASTGRNRWSTLLMILAIVTFANVMRRPIAMLHVGVGPITTRTGRLLARAILRQVDRLTVRDQGSYDTCRAIGVPADRVTLATDAVFSVDARWLLGCDTTAPEPRDADEPMRVALNLNFDIENPDAWDDFNERLADGLRALHERQPIELHLLPMQTGFKDHDDAQVLDEFAARLPGVPVRRHRPANHTDAARLIARCDVLVSERLHAIVMAAILGTPAFVLAYDVKVRELAAALGLERDTVDINQPFEPAQVTDHVARLAADRKVSGRALRCRALSLRTNATAAFDSTRAWVDDPHAVPSGR